ncbi:MAG TPA: R3H domain-containing nucleic acid-binding protein [Terriglobales bacterium]|nr:R3H domain-containing nucleic acid-binding protein [Terriglobales bacterium]
MPESMEARLGPRLREFLDAVLREGKFELSYRLLAPPPEPEGPELVVDFAGEDTDLLLADDGELLRALEYLAFETLRLGPDEHHRLVFDCQGRRALRLEELRTLARMAAERVLKTGLPYEFAPMNSRDRRTVHMALADHAELSSESEGVGRDRHIVVRSRAAGGPQSPGARREYRRL